MRSLRRSGSGVRFPALAILKSAKLWQKSYFYVENIHSSWDYVNLPAYVAGPPAEPRTNWRFRPKNMSAASSTALTRLHEMMESEGLMASDLLAAFVERRVLPLQARPHIISNMSGRRDPCRLSTKVMPDVEVVHMVNFFSDCKMSWRFGKPPYSRANPPPPVGLLIIFPLFVRVLFLPPDQSALVQRFPGQTATNALTAGHQYMADRSVSDVDDPDLGVAAQEEDGATSGGSDGAGSPSEGGLGDWPDDDEEDDEPRRTDGADSVGASSAAAPTAATGVPKRRADAGLFGSRPKKPKTSATATKRQEAAAKAALFQKGPKQRPMVSA